MSGKKLVINGRLPGLNEYIDAERRNRQAAAKMKREAEEIVIWSAKASLRGPIRTPVVMHYLWVEPNRKRDKDNISGYFHKIFQDALVEFGAIADDDWKHIRGMSDYFEVDKGFPRIEVVIEESR